MTSSILPKYTKNEEIMNAVTHGIGAGLSIAGLVVLVVFASMHGDVWKIVASAIYGASMIVLYTASTLYHSFSKTKAASKLNMFDHISIYYLIAGSYTPFMLVNLRGGWGWSIFGVVWACAIAGTVLKIIYGNKLRKVSTIIYLAMGWIIIIAIYPFVKNVETGGIILVVLGGLSYTIGVIFYKWKSLPFNHAIWHLFVLAGTVLQFFAVLFYVVLILKTFYLLQKRNLNDY